MAVAGAEDVAVRFIQLIDGKRKYSYPWLSISGERLAFLNDRYRVEIKNDWRGMFG